jgi:hypothetical protein
MHCYLDDVNIALISNVTVAVEAKFNADIGLSVGVRV